MTRQDMHKLLTPDHERPARFVRQDIPLFPSFPQRGAIETTQYHGKTTQVTGGLHQQNHQQPGGIFGSGYWEIPLPRGALLPGLGIQRRQPSARLQRERRSIAAPWQRLLHKARTV